MRRLINHTVPRVPAGAVVSFDLSTFAPVAGAACLSELDVTDQRALWRRLIVPHVMRPSRVGRAPSAQPSFFSAQPQQQASPASCSAPETSAYRPELVPSCPADEGARDTPTASPSDEADDEPMRELRPEERIVDAVLSDMFPNKTGKLFAWFFKSALQKGPRSTSTWSILLYISCMFY